MRPIAITNRNRHALSSALDGVLALHADNRVSLMRLFSCADQFEAQLKSYKLQRAHRVGAVGVIYGPARGGHFPTGGQTCTHALLERRRSGWFLTQVERLPAVCGCHLRLTLDQAERIIEHSDAGRVVLRAFDELRTAVEWHPRTDEMYRDTLRSIAALAASNPTVYSGLLNLAREDIRSIADFFRAVSQAAAKAKVLADRDARRAAQLSSSQRNTPPGAPTRSPSQRDSVP